MKGNSTTVQYATLSEVPRRRAGEPERLAPLGDKELDAALAGDPNLAPRLDAEWLKGAKLVLPDNPGKTRMTLRVDNDVLAWLRRHKGYQSRINTMLRKMMEADSAK